MIFSFSETYFDVPYKEQDDYICNSYDRSIIVNKKYF